MSWPLLLGVLPGLAVLGLLSGVLRQPQVTLSVTEGALHVELGRWDVVYCLRRGVSFPVHSVHQVSTAPKGSVRSSGLRLPGTWVPGVIRAGSYGTGSKRDFWNVRRGNLYLLIQLRPGAAYRRVVLEVPDPQAEADRLRAAIAAAGAAASPRDGRDS